MRVRTLAIVVLGSLLSFVYAFQTYQYVFWRGEQTGAPSRRSQQALVAGLALLVLLAGVWPEPLLSLSRDAAAVLPGASP